MPSSQLSTRSLPQMLCGSHIKIWNLANHIKKKWNKEHHLVFSFSPINLAFWCFLQDFKFQYVNRKAFYWVDYTFEILFFKQDLKNFSLSLNFLYNFFKCASKVMILITFILRSLDFSCAPFPRRPIGDHSYIT